MSSKTGVMFIDVEYKRMVILQGRILAEFGPVGAPLGRLIKDIKW